MFRFVVFVDILDHAFLKGLLMEREIEKIIY